MISEKKKLKGFLSDGSKFIAFCFWKLTHNDITFSCWVEFGLHFGTFAKKNFLVICVHKIIIDWLDKNCTWLLLNATLSTEESAIANKSGNKEFVMKKLIYRRDVT